MRLLVFLISLLVTFVVFSVLYYIVKTKIVPGNQVHQRLKNLGGGGERVVRTHAEELARIPFLDRTVLPLLSAVEKFFIKFAPSEIHATVEKKLMLAGKQGQWSVNRVITAWLLCQVVFLILGLHFSSNQKFTYMEGIIFVWVFVIFGITMNGIFGPGRIKVLNYFLYFAIGWSGIIFIPYFVKYNMNLLWYILIGGLTYTLGMIPFAFKKFKATHFVFHIIIVISAIIQWSGIFICLYL